MWFWENHEVNDNNILLDEMVSRDFFFDFKIIGQQAFYLLFDLFFIHCLNQLTC